MKRLLKRAGEIPIKACCIPLCLNDTFLHMHKFRYGQACNHITHEDKFCKGGRNWHYMEMLFWKLGKKRTSIWLTNMIKDWWSGTKHGDMEEAWRGEKVRGWELGKERKKSSSAQYQGWYCLQMILLPCNNTKSQFGREQSPFITKVQPTVHL